MLSEPSSPDRSPRRSSNVSSHLELLLLWVEPTFFKVDTILFRPLSDSVCSCSSFPLVDMLESVLCSLSEVLLRLSEVLLNLFRILFFRDRALMDSRRASQSKSKSFGSSTTAGGDRGWVETRPRGGLCSSVTWRTLFWPAMLVLEPTGEIVVTCSSNRTTGGLRGDCACSFSLRLSASSSSGVLQAELSSEASEAESSRSRVVLVASASRGGTTSDGSSS